MGSNKIACVHITRQNVRLLEGRVQSGVMLISRTATVSKAGRFFHEERLAYMSDMVTAIVNAMNVNSFTAKELHIIYDNSLEVQFFIDEKLTGQKDAKKGLNFSFGKKKDGEEGETKLDKAGVITHKKAWGKYITETEKGELYTTTTIERDLVNFMVSEFQEHGLKVASIEAPETALLYLRKMVPFTYDALNKLVVYAKDNVSGMFYQFTKDAPAGNKPFHFDDIPADNIIDQTIGVIKEEIRKSGLHNPHIMLVGNAFEDPETYIEICKGLREEGLFAIDLYGLWKDRGAPTNCVRVITADQAMEIETGGHYGLCVCLLAREMESKPENMVEGFHPMFIGKREKKMLASGLSFVMSLYLVYGLASAGIGVYENYVANAEYTRASNTSESQLAIAERERDTIKSRVDGLKTIDSRYNEIFRFVYEQVSDDLNIASVDTIDMIPTTTGSGSNYAAGTATTGDGTATGDGTTPTDGTQADPNAAATTPTEQQPQQPTGPVDVTGESSVTNYQFQTIVIRGYARTTEGPMALHNALIGAGLGEVKVVGIEQVPLPSKETLFAFEITVGSNEGV